MAVEIFSATPSSGATARTYGSELSVKAGSDIYFGKGAPGIAYFEKAGADLRVTLLDGQEVMLHDFFVIGPEGNASRLLDSAGGPVEVTGLLAPEPFQPETGAIDPDRQAAHAGPNHSDNSSYSEAPAQGTPQGAAGGDPSAAAATGSQTVSQSAETAAGQGAEGSDGAASDGAADGGGSGGWTLFGLGLDKLAFSSALGAILGEIIVSDDNSRHTSGTAAETSSADTAAAAETATADTAAVTQGSATGTGSSETAAAGTTSATSATDTASTDTTAAAELVSSLIGDATSSIDTSALSSAASGSAGSEVTAADSSASAASASDTAATDTAEAAGATDSAEAVLTATALTESEATFADLMQGGDDVYGG